MLHLQNQPARYPPSRYSQLPFTTAVRDLTYIDRVIAQREGRSVAKGLSECLSCSGDPLTADASGLCVFSSMMQSHDSEPLACLNVTIRNSSASACQLFPRTISRPPVDNCAERANAANQVESLIRNLDLPSRSASLDFLRYTGKEPQKISAVRRALRSSSGLAWVTQFPN